jgi:hypothetical protein
MFTTKQYRAKSSEYGELIMGSTDPSEIRKFQETKDRFSSLADNEEWLSDKFDKMIRTSGEQQPSPSTLATDEEYVLRCLGASVIMQWNTIPTKLQRELFDTAGSMGELSDTAELRGRIGKFLHKHFASR